jgi:tetratricopeptide (TPR) repeat protein
VAEHYKWTPALKKPEDLQKLLVGREALLKRLLQAIADAAGRKSPQHFLLVGPRGIGKTHLLLLLYYTIQGAIRWDEISQNLSKSWEPILFSEEQYGIGSLAELLIGTLQQLKEQTPDEKLKRLLAHVKDVSIPGETEREMILEYLLQRRSERGKRILLLLDNLQMILGNFPEEDQSRLRSILISHDLFMIVGSAPTLFEAVVDYEIPFYNFFEIVWLKEISKDDVKALLKKHLEHDKRTDILERFDDYRPRIRTIVHLTGGNPRLIVSLYQIFVEGEILEVERALLKLLDELTPYFQDRMKELSAQQRKIIDALALTDGLSTPTEIAHAACLEVNVVTTQLRRLKEQGYIRSHKEKGKRETLYDISDQLFRLWRQMRVEAGRRRLGFIVKFLKIWFSEQEISKFAGKLVREMLSRLSEAKHEQVRETIDRLYYVQEAAPSYMHSAIHYQRISGLAALDDLSEAERELQEREAQLQTREDKELFASGCVNLGAVYGLEGKYDQAAKWFRKALEVQPDKHEAWNNLGNVYAEKQEYDRAIEAYRRALEIKPDDHEAWNNLGNVYAEKQEYDRAIEAYRRALEIKPDMHEAWYNLGNAYADKQEYDRAIEAYHKALEIKPDMHEAWYNLGNAYADKQEYDRAIEAYHKALEIKPDDHEAWNNLGNVYAHKQEYDRAIEAYRRALEIKPDKHEAWYNLGVTYAEKQEYDRAIEAYRRALEIKPDKHEAWYNLGVAYAHKQEYDRAIEAYRRALEIKPDKHEAWYNLGVAYAHKQEYDRAIEAYRRALEIKPDKHEAWYNLGSAYIGKSLENLDNENKALQHYENALSCLLQVSQFRGEAQEILIAYFRELLQAKALSLAEKSLKLVESQGQDWAELLRPYRAALDYLKTKDKSILNRLFPEIRQIVEEMVAHVEGKQGKTG